MYRHHHNLLLSAALVLALGACSKSAAPVTDTAAGLQAVIDEAARNGGLANGDAPLKQGQSIQGMIEAEVGNGQQSFRSLATKVADDIGKQMDGKLDSGTGQRAIDEANRKLEKLGTETRIAAEDVRDFVGSMAGKTFHDSEVRQIDMIKTLQVTLKGTAGDGGTLEIGLNFNDSSLALNSANLTYRPETRSVFDYYQSTKKAPPQVNIERFEKNSDGSYAIAGSFQATNLPASNMAKQLKGSTLPLAQGRFDFAALPLKGMPKFGGL